jgi:hypothetical protein
MNNRLFLLIVIVASLVTIALHAGSLAEERYYAALDQPAMAA